MLRTIPGPLLLSIGVLSCGSFKSAGEGSGGDASTASSSSGSSGSSGASSSGGAGQVEVLAAGLSIPRDVTPTDAGVYWVSTVPTEAGSGGRLHRCDLGGCGGQPAQMVDEYTGQVAGEAAQVFWTSNDSLRGCTTGPTCTPRTLLGGVTALGDVTAEGGKVYFTTNTSTAGTLQHCAPDACSPTLLWSGQTIGAWAISGTDVYLTTGQPAKDLVRVRGVDVTLLGTLPGLPTGLAALGSHVFFVSTSVIYQCEAATSCTPVPFAPTASSVYAVRVHGGAVYFSIMGAGGTPGGIRRCAPDDCASPTTILDGGNPRDFAIRDGWLYFADHGDLKSGGASIRRARLPD